MLVAKDQFGDEAVVVGDATAHVLQIGERLLAVEQRQVARTARGVSNASYIPPHLGLRQRQAASRCTSHSSS